MTFVSSDIFLSCLKNLTDNYQAQTQLSLEESPQPYAVSCYFGAKDIERRRQQIQFIVSCYNSLTGRFKEDLFFTSEEEIKEHIRALRILNAVVDFILADIRKNSSRSGATSVLKQLLEAALGNPLDPRTEAICMLEARDYVKDCQHFADLDWWQKFAIFLKDKCDALEQAQSNPYPITSILMPFFSRVFQQAGNRSAYFIADNLRRSAQFRDMRYTVTAAIGANLFLIIRPTRMNLSIFFLAPSLIEILANTFCTETIVFLLENVMKILGKGVGFSVGMALDVSLKLLYNLSSLISNVFEAYQGREKLNGFSLIDGQRVSAGIKLKINHIETPPPYAASERPYEQITFAMQPEGLDLQIGEGPATIQKFLHWDSPLTENLQKEFSEYNQLYGEREYEVLPSAPLLQS